MIVRPTSTNPRGQLGRALRIAGFVAPPVLLLLVVGAGIAGPRPEPTPPPASPPATIEAGPTAPPLSMRSDVPDVAAGLAVRTVTEAQPVLARADGAPIAVAGWLGSLEADAGCETATGDTRGILSPLCERTMRLEPGPTGSSAAAHIHVRIPPGVRLPPPFEWPGAGRADPVPVVLVGRAASPDDACVESTRGCGERLTLDLVTWATDGPFEPGVIFDAGLELPPPAIAYRRQADAEALATGLAGTVLVSAVVRPSTVAAIDPEAATVMDGAPAPDGLVWYVRSLEITLQPTRFPPGDVDDLARERWVVVDEATGSVLAIGITGQIDAPPTANRSAAAPPRAILDQGTGLGRAGSAG